MNRRGVLKGLGVATAAALWPGWLREAFAGPPCGVMRGTATLAAALKRAHDGVKPLLMLIIPTDSASRSSWGEHFGEWLNHGSDQDLAPLASAEVVCAELATVQQLFPSAPKDYPEPAVLVADIERVPAQLGIALRSFPLHADEAEDAAIQQCIDRTGSAVRMALTGDGVALERRAAALWQRLDGGRRQAVQRVLDGSDVPLATVLEMAPVLAAKAHQDPALAAPLTKVLAAAARAAYCRQRIPGSKWASSDGCGETIEGEVDQVMVDCGMGLVPPQSRRFLYFFTNKDRFGP